MKNFAELFSKLYQTNKTNEKVAALKQYFSKVSDEDKIWALALFTYRRPKSPVNFTQLTQWAIEVSSLPEWLFYESYLVAGDLAETISLLLPFPQKATHCSLTEWMKMLISLSQQEEEVKKRKVLKAWEQLDQEERLVFNKILTGVFRIGVSYNLVVKALSEITMIEKTVIAHRIMGNWNPVDTEFSFLFDKENKNDAVSRPYPFFLAYAIDGHISKLGNPSEWQAEWKWDGIRSQIILRDNSIFIWSRGEELITDKFPEFHLMNNIIPQGTVMDGEILPYLDGKPLPFQVLQTRIGRKNVSAKHLKEAPVVFMAYDLLEWEENDIRTYPLTKRRGLLKKIVEKAGINSFLYSEEVHFSDWQQIAELRLQSRNHNAEGFMIKRKNSFYLTGRKRGDWWKWKIDPYSIDAVLIYAQKGSGKRAHIYTDYTFGVWHGDSLVPFAKAYSGLTDQEIKEVDKFIRNNTMEKFGPVRTVKPELVFEIGFEAIARSSRHKSGVAVRFPRILHWRKDKKSDEADRLEELIKMVPE